MDIFGAGVTMSIFVEKRINASLGLGMAIQMYGSQSQSSEA